MNKYYKYSLIIIVLVLITCNSKKQEPTSIKIIPQKPILEDSISNRINKDELYPDIFDSTTFRKKEVLKNDTRFREFLDQFFRDTLFQKAHIIYPLPSRDIYKNEYETIKNHLYNKKDSLTFFEFEEVHYDYFPEKEAFLIDDSLYVKSFIDKEWLGCKITFVFAKRNKAFYLIRWDYEEI